MLDVVGFSIVIGKRRAPFPGGKPSMHGELFFSGFRDGLWFQFVGFLRCEGGRDLEGWCFNHHVTQILVKLLSMTRQQNALVKVGVVRVIEPGVALECSCSCDMIKSLNHLLTYCT